MLLVNTEKSSSQVGIILWSLPLNGVSNCCATNSAIQAWLFLPSFYCRSGFDTFGEDSHFYNQPQCLTNLLANKAYESAWTDCLHRKKRNSIQVGLFDR